MNKKTLLLFGCAGMLILGACKQGDNATGAATGADSTNAAATAPAVNSKEVKDAQPADPFADPVKRGISGHLVEKIVKEGNVGVINYGAGDGKVWSQNNMAAKTMTTIAGEVLAANIDLNAVKITVQDTGKKYELNVTRAELEKFLGKTLSEASKNWTMDYIMKLPANKEARDKFVQQFVKVQ